MKEHYGRVCSQCGRLYKYNQIPKTCKCGKQLIYEYFDKMKLTVYEPDAIPVTYHRNWRGKYTIVPLENWAKNFQEAEKNWTNSQK